MVVLHLLNSLRAEDGDEVGGVTFREGEAIGESNWSYRTVQGDPEGLGPGLG